MSLNQILLYLQTNSPHSLRFPGLFSMFSVIKPFLGRNKGPFEWTCIVPPTLTLFVVVDYSGNASGARRAKKRSSGESPGDGQTLRSSGRQTNARVKRTNNPPPGQVSCSLLWLTKTEASTNYLVFITLTNITVFINSLYVPAAITIFLLTAHLIYLLSLLRSLSNGGHLECWSVSLKSIERIMGLFC